MKKSIIIAIISLFVIYIPCNGQTIWDSDLGSVEAGDVDISWNTTNYEFQTNGGTEEPGGKDFASILNSQLTSAGITWVSVQYVENPGSGQFEIDLVLQQNNSLSSRSVIFGTSSDVLCITQGWNTNNPTTIDLPASGIIRFFPETSTTLHLHHTVSDRTYSIKRIYPSGYESTIGTFVGNSGDYSYTLLNEEGAYRIEGVPNSNFTVSLYDAFKCIFPSDRQTVTISQDGGSYYWIMTSFTDAQGNEQTFENYDELNFLQPILDTLNSGVLPYWNNHVKLSIGYQFDGSENGYIFISCPPNLSPDSIQNHSFLRTSTSSSLDVSQAGHGGLGSASPKYRCDPSIDSLTVEIMNSAPKVSYSLYKGNDIVVSKEAGDGGGYIKLTALKMNGRYLISASYTEGTFSASDTICEFKVVGGGSAALPTDRNWVFSKTYGYDISGNDRSLMDVTYYDGLGYPQQEVGIGAVSEGNGDLVRPIVYDHLRRESVKYLPYASISNYGAFDTVAVVHQQTFYRNKYGLESAEPYALTEDRYESSADGRIVASLSPGIEYRSDTSRFVRNRYITNTGSFGDFPVPKLIVNRNTESLTNLGIYPQGALSGIKTINEDGAVSVVFKDNEERTVSTDTQVRNSDGTVTHCITLYAYDWRGRLAWVVTPEGSSRLEDGTSYDADGTFAGSYCYVYLYDSKSRVKEKRIPGRDPQYFVYDKGDRIALVQGGNDRQGRRWMTTKYDSLGRPSEQGLVTDVSGMEQVAMRDSLQAAFDRDSVPELYRGSSTLLRLYAYDSYSSFSNDDLTFIEEEGVTETGGTSHLDLSVKGLPVYEKTAVLTDSTLGFVNGYREKAYYYDYRSRVIQEVEASAQHDIHRLSTLYDLRGNVLSKKERYDYTPSQDTVPASNTLDRTYAYDTRDRLINETASVDGGEAAIVTSSYDDLGRLTNVNYGTGSDAVHETLTYNIQGWLTGKSSELFEMELRYFNPQKSGSTALYSGNVSEWSWKHKLLDGTSDGELNTYSFSYDDLSRLKSVSRYVSSGSAAVQTFTENGITYDRNGDLLTLQRNGSSASDYRNFSYTYDKGRRSSENVLGRSYSYDRDGNVTKDGVNSLQIRWNLLDLPLSVSDFDGYEQRYTYLADGTKVGRSYRGTEYAYSGSLTYKDGWLESVPFGGGRIEVDSAGVASVHYFLTDHLGSARVIALVNGGGRWIQERSDYYPFGEAWKTNGMPSEGNRYTFSGKEESGLWLDDEGETKAAIQDFGARYYDSEGVMWLSQDPNAEKYYPISPYAYCSGNPVRFIDPDGRMITLPKGTSTKNIYLVLGNLQKLTNDRLVYSTQKNGNIRIKVASLGEGNKTAGTNLIRGLNSSDRSLTIDVQNSQGYFTDGVGNKATATNYTNAANGTGSDAIVSFDPTSNPSIMTKDPKTGNVSGKTRPNQIGLGHELIHAEHYMDGDYSPATSTSTHTYKDASGNTITQTYKTEELRTVGVAGTKKGDITENQLRKEQKQNSRGAY